MPDPVLTTDSQAEPAKSDRILAQVDLLRERERVVDVEEMRVKVVIFTIEEGLYALYGENVREILPRTEISPVPGTPPFVAGLVNVRGDVESVIDIRSYLGMPATPEPRGLIALAAKGDVRSGVLVDAVVDVIDVPAGGIKPPLTTLDAAVGEIVAGSLGYAGKSVTLLDIGAIFGKISV